MFVTSDISREAQLHTERTPSAPGSLDFHSQGTRGHFSFRSTRIFYILALCVPMYDLYHVFKPLPG